MDKKYIYFGVLMADDVVSESALRPQNLVKRKGSVCNVSPARIH
jgi:hypothetical protein